MGKFIFVAVLMVCLALYVSAKYVDQEAETKNAKNPEEIRALLRNFENVFKKTPQGEESCNDVCDPDTCNCGVNTECVAGCYNLQQERIARTMQ